jgi:thiamine biosynthesis protein ThiS
MRLELLTSIHGYELHSPNKTQTKHGETLCLKHNYRIMLYQCCIHLKSAFPEVKRAVVPGDEYPRVGRRGFCYFCGMRLVINAEERNFSASTLDALIEELGMKSDRVAVELNREIVPRANWSATALNDGDRLEIVHFVGGG